MPFGWRRFVGWLLAAMDQVGDEREKSGEGIKQGNLEKLKKEGLMFPSMSDQIGGVDIELSSVKGMPNSVIALIKRFIFHIQTHSSFLQKKGGIVTIVPELLKKQDIVIYDEVMFDPWSGMRACEIAFENLFDQKVQCVIEHSPSFLKKRMNIIHEDVGKYMVVKSIVKSEPAILFRSAESVYECESCGNVVTIDWVFPHGPSDGPIPGKCLCGSKKFSKTEDRKRNDVVFSIFERENRGNPLQVAMPKMLWDVGSYSLKSGDEIEAGGIYGVQLPIGNVMNRERHEILAYSIVKVSEGVLGYDDIEGSIDSLGPFEYEEFVGDLYSKMGYAVEVTQKSGDFGIDVIARKGSESIGIQCKHFTNGTPVGNSTVQKAIGAVSSPYDLTKVVVVSSSGFSKAAFEVQSKSRIPVELIDKPMLVRMVAEHMHGRINMRKKGMMVSDDIDYEVQKSVMRVRDFLRKAKKDYDFGKLHPKHLVDIAMSYTSSPFGKVKEAIEQACNAESISMKVDWDRLEKEYSEKDKIDIDRISTGIGIKSKTNADILLELIKTLKEDSGASIHIDTIKSEALKIGMDDARVDETLERLRRMGDIFESRRDYISIL